jgi:FkbH-like protein
VVHLDGDPALHVANLLRDGWFDVRELTTEDRDRVSRYREELARKDFLQTFDSLEQYRRELRVVVRLGRAQDSELARVSQLSLRTNQFNLTADRLQPGQVAALAADRDALVLTVRSEDRFGANGLVGAVLAHRVADELHIDNFLLSCRVFSRGIEQACLSTVLRHARETGVSTVTAAHRRTSRNTLVREFYPGYGFQLVRDDGVTRTYRHDLGEIPPVPEHVRLHADLGANPGGTTP